MAPSLFDNLKKLYEQELYTSAIELGEILLKSYVRNKSLLSPIEYYQTLAYLGHTYYLSTEYDAAEKLFRQALAARRILQRNDLPANLAAICEENELKYKTAQCLTHLNHKHEAIGILESIPLKQRVAKVHYLHGQLNKQNRSASAAIFSLKEVLKEHQLALDVAETLLELGVSGLEVNSLVVDATHWPHCSDWLANWIQAHAFLAAHNYKTAAIMFKQIKNDSPIQNHHRMLVQIGKCHFYDGCYDLALRYLEKAHAESPQHCGEGIILLANLLCRSDNRHSDLESLAATVTNVQEYRPEHWFILALKMFFIDRYYERVDCFLEKAKGKSLFLDIEVALLKANVCLQLQKVDQALLELRGIQKVAAHRFELYKNFVDIYARRGKTKDAEFYASLAAQVLGKSQTRTLMLYAKAYERDNSMRGQMKSLLCRIHKMDENYLPAIYMLVDLLVKDKEYEEAVRILRLQVAVQPNARMAVTMGDICVLLKEHSNALGFYNMAVRLDPTCQKAINALNGMAVEGKRGAGGSGAEMGTMGSSCAMEKGGGTFDNNMGEGYGGGGGGDLSGVGGELGGSLGSGGGGGGGQNETMWEVDGEMNNN